MNEPLPTTLVLAGGLGLGAYQAGAYGALARSERLSIEAVGGASIGAINAAILAGNAPDQRMQQLEGFWRSVETDVASAPMLDPFDVLGSGPFRRARNWGSAATSHLAGAPGFFSPALGGLFAGGTPALYDTGPLLSRFAERIDFDRLNSGSPRYVLAATDVETGDLVVLDTAEGDEITPEHLLASGGLMPSFPARRIGGRLLGDGGFSANAPLDPFLSSVRRRPASPVCMVVDLFSPDGPAPRSLEDARQRANDLTFACQTGRNLQGLIRERALEARLPGERACEGTEVFHLSYLAGPDEAGAEKPYDLSRATLTDRRCAGAADADAALAILTGLQRPFAPGLRVHRVRRQSA